MSVVKLCALALAAFAALAVLYTLDTVPRPMLSPQPSAAAVTVTHCIPLAHPSRPAFLTAGSALVLSPSGDALIFSDDAHHGARVPLPLDPSTTDREDAGGADGVEFFDLSPLLPPQSDKHDLEAAVSLPPSTLLPAFTGLGAQLVSPSIEDDDLLLDDPAAHHHTHVLVFGSGSVPVERDIVALLHLDDTADAQAGRYPALYEALRGPQGAHTSELNVEGVSLLLPRSLAHCAFAFLHRANGKDAQTRGGAVVGLPCPASLLHLAEPDVRRVPRPAFVFDLALGSVDGVPLTATDIEALPPRCAPHVANGSFPASYAAPCFAPLLVLSAAEDTDSPLADGPIAGAAVAFIELNMASTDGRDARAPLSFPIHRIDPESGASVPDITKYEGIVLNPHDPTHGSVYLVSDPDSTTTPATLCTASLPPHLVALITDTHVPNPHTPPNHADL